MTARVLPNWVSQIAGALVAALSAMYLTGGDPFAPSGPTVVHATPPSGFVAVTFGNTPSSRGVIARSRLAQITRSHSRSHFFDPVA